MFISLNNLGDQKITINSNNITVITQENHGCLIKLVDKESVAVKDELKCILAQIKEKDELL
jgi:hypothetical protein